MSKLSSGGNVSQAVVRRLSRYYRHLHEMLQEDVHRISSQKLADRLGLTASQIRQDLNCFGGFGQQGYGYNVEILLREIGGILGVRRGLAAILIGVGNMGRALCNNFDFSWAGIRLIGIFDNNPDVVGSTVGGFTVQAIERLDAFAERRRPDIAVLTLPRELAPAMAERLTRLSVRGLWNFTGADLHLSIEGAAVENVNFADSLLTLSYRVGELL
ncbi:MAG: redox-sensing transcriptional repressor Rex [Oscillospiraceae bacterium]|jgi:redox-sensing transcriptional repressor|nr:redox-sensing transcriptional repressor Rex [Oscillospiraceae bacterium]